MYFCTLKITDLETENFEYPRSICVFCGSSSQVHPHFFAAAQQLGQLMASNAIRLIYGGGDVGLMGELANAVLDNGGNVTGVIPQFMIDAGWHHQRLVQMIVTETMHQRKAKMAELSEAVVALPGGVGTFEELFEVITWKQLGLITKPVVIVNIDGYYDLLLQMLDRMVEQHFMREIHRNMWTVVNSASEILEAIRNAPQWDRSVRKIAAI